MSEELLVGIDAGLSNLKAVIFDASGVPIATASRRTPGEQPTPDREEQDHDTLWAATVSVVSEALSAEGVDADDVAGVGVAGHGHGLYALDESGDPVCGIKSTDSRASDLVDAWRDDGTLDELSDRLGWEPFGADPFSLLAWLAREEPDVYDRIDVILSCKDVLKHRLTGVASTDTMEASALEPSGGDGDAASVFETLGLDDAVDALPSVVDSTDSCGTVTPAAAEETGLPVGTPVAAGLHDVGACALGAGTIHPGQATVILGTWGQSVVVTDGPEDGRGGLPRRYLDGWIRYRGTRAGAACLDWFVEEFGSEWRQAARERDIDPFAVYDETAADVPVGSDGVLFHPYHQGSTADPNARGGFYGLRLNHTKAHLLRAVYEGIAIELCSGVRDLRADVSDLRLTGGGAKSETWANVFVNVFGERVRIPAGDEMGARGAAICAGVAAGRYDAVDEAVEEFVSIDQTYQPNPDAVESYKTVTKAYQQARVDAASTWRTLKAVSEKQGTR